MCEMTRMFLRWVGENIKLRPASTRTGITRYEAWQLTRVKGDKTPGFVSVAVVAENFHRDLLPSIDATINKWADTLN
jgi:hypothetical protein